MVFRLSSVDSYSLRSSPPNMIPSNSWPYASRLCIAASVASMFNFNALAASALFLNFHVMSPSTSSANPAFTRSFMKFSTLWAGFSELKYLWTLSYAASHAATYASESYFVDSGSMRSGDMNCAAALKSSVPTLPCLYSSFAWFSRLDMEFHWES